MTTIGELWRDHRAGLHRFVTRRVADRHDAEDIVQDVFLKAHESLHQLRSTERSAAWLARIAAHRIVDHYRARRVTIELPDEIAAEEPDDDPFAALAECLPDMIEQLPAVYRDALQLSEIDGVAQKDVAKRMQISLSGAKSRVQRGRRLLRQLIERCCRALREGRAISGFEPVPLRCACGPTAGHRGLRPS